jgi:uncharacterized protein YecT (DUF1311 family)
MGQSGRGRPMGSGRRGGAGDKLAMAAVSAIGMGVLAGCSGSSSSTGSSATPGTTATASAASSSSATAPAASATVTMTAPSSAAALVPITEPFDSGHPARTMPGPSNCASQPTTLAIVQCYEDKTETADAAIDAAQQGKFAAASAAQRAAMNAAGQAWLAARPTVCAKAYHTGGTIDQVNIASCLLDESTARLNAVKNIQPPLPVLKSTDSQNPGDISWYTTPEGSRIGLVDTQGDATGGVIIAWTIIAGADGFVVIPAQFYYSDGTFRDAGIIEKPDPSGHRVAPGTEYTFGIDYSSLAHDPNPSTASGGFEYAPLGPAAVWR